MKEIFKQIEYKGLKITVSNYGKVIWNGNERNCYYNADGYAMCSLKIPNKGWRSVFIHILVATAFVPNPDNLPEVNHKDYNRANPNSDNLEWTTRKENVRYSICNMPDYHGINNPNYKNKTLSEKYKNNKELSKEKQGRHATQNGRSTPIDLYYDGNFMKSFEYIIPCCQYLINIGESKTDNPEVVRSQINKSIRNKSLYKGHYSFIKR